MTDEIRKELKSVPISYTDENLQETFYTLLKPKIRENMADKLAGFLTPMVGRHLTEDEKAFLIYKVLSECITYDDTEYSKGAGKLRYTYAGGITSGKAVCMGIAELYTLLCTAVGLRVQTIIGYGGDPVHDGGLHAWNQIWLKDGDKRIPYHLDLTWDLAANARLRGFRYYLKSDSYMEEHDHTWLKERYPCCPKNRSSTDIPKIRPEAVQFLCKRFQNMSRALSLT